MNKELLKFIRTLSENDTKTLTEKALKTTEEVGELAKAVLPYENVAGTLHRFVSRRKIFEEAVDTMLCALSIAHDLEYSDEEIEAMMLQKATYWQGLQVKEGSVEFPLPYEIHVTVSTDDIEAFKFTCKSIKVKPIVLDLEKDGEVVMVDVMTSSVHFGDNVSAMTEATRIAETLIVMDYKVSRIKIETVPWHPAAPSINDANPKMPLLSYFESHLRIVTNLSRRNELEGIANEYNAHLSRNTFKKLSQDEYIIMMTLRNSTTQYEPFKEEVDRLSKKLRSENFVVDKTEIEFAVYDTNTTHDKLWLQKLKHH